MNRFGSFLHCFKLLLFIIVITCGYDIIAKKLNIKKEETIIELKDFFFFTNIALTYTIICIFIGMCKRFNPLLNCIHLFISITGFILEILVTISFWILYFIDPKLVKGDFEHNNITCSLVIQEFPKHLIPLILLFLENLNIKHRRSFYHFMFFLFFSFIYFLINEIYAICKLDFLYPFLNYFSPLQRFCFFLLMFGLSISSYIIVLFIKNRENIKEKTD